MDGRGVFGSKKAYSRVPSVTERKTSFTFSQANWCFVSFASATMLNYGYKVQILPALMI